MADVREPKIGIDKSFTAGNHLPRGHEHLEGLEWSDRTCSQQESVQEPLQLKAHHAQRNGRGDEAVFMVGGWNVAPSE
jgi:hypothetical protein